MKKTLMTVLVMASICLHLTSCSKDEVSYGPEDKKASIINEYSTKFSNYVGGYINPQQSWGFGTDQTASSRVVTRGEAEGFDLFEYDYKDTETRFTKDFYDAIYAKLPEGKKASESTITNYEFEMHTNCFFDIFLISTTQENLEIGYYYYNPKNETALDHHDVKMVGQLAKDMKEKAYYQYTCYTEPNPNQWNTPDISDGYGIWEIPATVYYVHSRNFSIPPAYIPEGYRIGFYVKNGDKICYTNKYLNDAEDPFFAALAEKDGVLQSHYIVGMEDLDANKQDNDCNDVMLAIRKFEVGHPILITPEKPQPEKWVRIIGEDLNTHSGESDFDFNDIVLDVKLTSTGADCILQAAGATLPIRINQDDKLEVHSLFKVDGKTMVNTKAKEIGLKGQEVDPVSFQLSGSFSTVDDIVIEVNRGNEANPIWIKFFADRGKPACKIAIDNTVTWPDERVSLKSVYPKFTDWVKDPSVQWY